MPTALYEEKTRGNGNTPENFTNKATTIKEIIQIVKVNAEQANAEQMRHYNLRKRECCPVLRSLVLARQHQLFRGVDSFAANLAPKYDGPFRVSPIRVSYESRGLESVRGKWAMSQS